MFLIEQEKPGSDQGTELIYRLLHVRADERSLGAETHGMVHVELK